MDLMVTIAFVTLHLYARASHLSNFVNLPTCGCINNVVHFKVLYCVLMPIKRVLMKYIVFEFLKC